MSNVKAIILRDNKSVKEILVPDSLCTGQLDISVVPGIKSKGHDDIERECDYEWNNDVISMYCWSEGSESKINKHHESQIIKNIMVSKQIYQVNKIS